MERVGAAMLVRLNLLEIKRLENVKRSCWTLGQTWLDLDVLEGVVVGDHHEFSPLKVVTPCLESMNEG